MKRIFFISIVLLSSFYFTHAQKNQMFFYHNGDKIYLDKIENTKIIHFSKTIDLQQKDNICRNLTTDNYIVAEVTQSICKVLGKVDNFDEHHVISTALKNGDIIYTCDILMYKDSAILWSSNEIIVRISEESNLRNLLQDNEIPFVDYKQIGHNKQTYVVDLDVTENNAIEYANKLFKAEDVIWAQPSFWRLIRKLNPYYSSQWGLDNTGQYDSISGIDINATLAWNISTGTGIKVAVLDEGIDLNHPDLINNLLPGYDATDATYGGSNGGYGGDGCWADTHGTACSGIIAAEDNNIGIKGIAYEAQIIPIRIGYGGDRIVDMWGNCVKSGLITYDFWVADAIYKAWHDYGADILSNSWGGGPPSELIDQAIDSALTQGRNSLGCVMVFAAGNDNISEVLYPACLSNVIAVGAMSSCGERKSPISCDGELYWGSSYGQNIDIMAPGVLVATTDIQGDDGYNSELPIHVNNGGNKIINDFADDDYTVWFNGTSAACPHVSGVAALILSVNPNLTQQQVRNIIESTAQKVGGYNYQTTSCRPNGTWHEEMGYGLINAHDAVLAAQCYISNLPIKHGVITANTTWSTPVQAVQVEIPSGVTLTITSEVSCGKNSTFTVLPGGRLVIDGGTLTNACPGKLWYGIFVSGNTNLPQNARNQGILELINGAVIENAKEAISTCALKTNGDIDWDRRGGIIYADNATIKNNRRSMEFLAYENVSNGRVYPNLSYFKNCQFIVDDSNLFATSNTKFLNHFTMWGVSGVKIQGCKFENNITTMPARKSAIYTLDAGYFVDEICPSGAYNLTSCLCRNSQPSSFTGFDKAIESSNSTLQYAISIDRSVFTKNITGIKLTAKNNIQLSRLKIDMNNLYSNYSTGIRLDDCNGYKIEGNEIYSTGTGYSTGICVNAPNIDEEKIYRNNIHNAQYGIKVINTPIVQPLRSFPATGLQFVCNDLQDNNYDIYVDMHSTIRASQGSSFGGADNLFTIPCISNFLVATLPPQVNYYRDPSVPRKEPVCKSGIIVSNATLNPCINTFCYNGGINDKSSTSSLAEYKELKSKYSEMLNHFYAKGYDKILNDYYNSIIENEELLKEAMLYHEAILAVTESMALLSHDALFALKTDTIIDLHQIRDWYEEIYTLSAKYSLAETYYQLGNFAEGMRTLSLIPEMYKLNEDEMMEHQNYLSLYTFKNDIAESGRTIAQLTEDEIITMQHFAEASSGLSSKIAQGILCFFYDICLDDVMIRGLDDERMKGEEQKSRRAEEQKSRKGESEKGDSYGLMFLRSYGLENITIVPNPTTGELTIDNGQLTINNVEVFDIYGRKQNIQFHSYGLIILRSYGLSNLPSGIYFVKIFTEKGEIVKKIVKQ